MGRTIVPYRWIFEEEKNYLYKRLQKTRYAREVKEMFTGGAQYNDAGSNWSNGQVRDKVLFIALFNQYKELLLLLEKKIKNDP